MTLRVAITAVFLGSRLLIIGSAAAQQGDRDYCEAASSGVAYSNAYVHRETGDTLGYAIVLRSDNKAIVYVYEGGAPSQIELPFERTGNRVVIRGVWHEKLIEYPSRREFVKDRPVLVDGVLLGDTLKAMITIADLDRLEVKLKRVAHILGCGKR